MRSVQINSSWHGCKGNILNAWGHLTLQTQQTLKENEMGKIACLCSSVVCWEVVLDPLIGERRNNLGTDSLQQNRLKRLSM